ncbi:cytochrome P450 [Streptomyces sp. OF3]|uniref:Cytochrome P450 n=1 Tax=Streptomyces alkaliterrae TaxID=2213162 RepID=A0A7W3ZPY1_9ACTN|nr:cytochrome P450 [Streptomyces alkaliterrae]MBB1256120.1 cytochrome P450 [Streptomyces alkaliterrae]
MRLSQHRLFPLDPHADPVAEAERLRALGPLVPVELPGGVAAWAATDLETCRLVLGSRDLSKDPRHWPELTNGRIHDDWELIALVRGAAMLHQDGADHRRLRTLVGKAFSRSPMAAMAPRVERIAEELVDDLGQAGTDEIVDLRETYARPLPIRVICELLGVPDSVVAELRGPFERLVSPPRDGSAAQSAHSAMEEVFDQVAALVEAKRTAPGQDLTSELIAARDDGDGLDDRELVETIYLLLIAGHETTVNSIVNTLHALLTRPAQLAAVLASEDPHVWENVVEEGLRYSSPIRHALLRYAVADTIIADVEVGRGEPVLAGIFASGRDPQTHCHPNEFLHSRTPRPEHVAFGHGPHHCVGSQLGRLETATALRTLLRRFPDVTPVGAPERLSSIPLQGLAALTVRLRGGRAEPRVA